MECGRGRERASAALDADPAVRLRVQVLGVPGSGRRTFAAAVAARAGFASLLVDSDDVDPGDWPRVFARAQRQAFLLGMALIWSGEALRRRWPASPDMFALQFVVGESGAELPPHGALVDHFVELKLPTIDRAVGTLAAIRARLGEVACARASGAVTRSPRWAWRDRARRAPRPSHGD